MIAPNTAKRFEHQNVPAITGRAKTDEAAVEKAWSEYNKTRTPEDKNVLLTHYLYLVKSIVARMMPTYGNHNDYDDLFSCGVIGLMDAIEKYDVKRNVKFETYAVRRVRGEILDSMRKQDWAPSSLRRKINALGKASSELEGMLGREPTETEIADYMDMSVAELRKLIDRSHMFNIVHFEDVLLAGSHERRLANREDFSTAAQVERIEIRDALGTIIDALPYNEKTVIALYYYKELTFKEIARILQVSESWVSQIHSRTLLKLKDKLKDTLFG
ncbi:MAG: FliA/WhiG family RNA polymerase sigma factor [Clostridiales bacterium]|nr:FliA/WhiG family RNA polymerase sigma factor [Clostridiales bacterium]